MVFVVPSGEAIDLGSYVFIQSQSCHLNKCDVTILNNIIYQGCHHFVFNVKFQ